MNNHPRLPHRDNTPARLVWLLCAVIPLLSWNCRRTTSPQKTGAKSKASQPQRARVAPKKKPPSYHVLRLDSPAQIVPFLLRHRPQAIGFGEYHQLKRFRHISPSIERFTNTILPALQKPPALPDKLKRGLPRPAPTSTNTSKQITDKSQKKSDFLHPLRDLLVETWITTGQCGKQEKVVVKQVTKVIERPKKVKNHILALLKGAKKRKIQPHILRVHSKQYEKLTKTNGTLDSTRFIRFVTDRLAQDSLRVLKIRNNRKQPGAIILYGGALHNDLHPTKTLAPFSYAHRLKGKLEGPLLEVDLYVPEYIAADQDFHQEPWFAEVEKLKHTNKTLLIYHPPRTYTLIFPWSKTAKKPKK